MAKRWQPEGSLAIVTGASSGMGRAFCRLIAARGCQVVVVARREDRLRTLCDEFEPGLLHPVVGDITNPTVRDSTFQLAQGLREGRLDLLVNNAGIGAIGPFCDASEERLRRIMEVNFFAPTEWTRQALPMLKRGRQPVICNVGSVLGHRAVPDKSEYSASKFALHGWTDSLRAEVSEDGIQCTLVSPSTTESEFFDSLIDTESESSSVRFGAWKPEKVARTMLAAITSRRSEVICSVGGKALVYADRISPPLMNAVLAMTAKKE
ncbi:MAG: SDR family NAD(P)-dependent oxidoreductase [Planctomycetota bacterium]